MLKRNTLPRACEDLTPRQLADLAEKYREQSECMLSCMRMMCYLVKDLPFGLEEAKACDFRKRLDTMVNSLEAADSPRAIQSAFEKGKDSILDFIAREKQYLNERESELKQIIDFLHKSLASVLGENSDFNTQLYEQNLRMEKLSHLDDIRKIKQSLQTEVEIMSSIIQAKQSSDQKRIEKLSKEVQTLRSSLEEVKGTAMTDALTKAANRLAFDTGIREQVEHAEMHRKPLALLMCDIDDFRSFNTRYGHRIGDAVLKVFVAKCKSVLRETDMICRYGGDEFAIILPGTNLRQAARVAQRICQAVNATKYVYDSSNGKVEFAFSASLGASEYHRYDKVSAIIDRADKALYTAKSLGKGGVCSEKDVHPSTLAA